MSLSKSSLQTYIQSKTPYFFSYYYVHPFRYIVLLWCFAYCEMSLDPMLLTQLHKLWICVLNTIFWSKAFDLPSCLVFYFNFSHLELEKHFWLVSYEVHLNLSWVINKNHKIHVLPMMLPLLYPKYLYEYNQEPLCLVCGCLKLYLILFSKNTILAETKLACFDILQ